MTDKAQAQTKYSEQDIKDLKDLVASRTAQGVETSLDLDDIQTIEDGAVQPNGPLCNKADALLRHHKKDIARRDKRIADYYNGPVSRREIVQTYATKAQCKQLSQIIDVLMGVIKKNKLATGKELDKLFQSVQLKEYPDLCNSCSNMGEDKKCNQICNPGEGATLAKEKLPALTGKKAKQVIGCASYKSKGLT